MEGKIQKNTYDEIRLSLVDMEDELNKLVNQKGGLAYDRNGRSQACGIQ